MLLTIKQSGPGSEDLGWLLHKHPDKAQEFPLSFGKAHVFFTESAPEATEAAMLLDIDPVDIVRSNRQFASAGHPLSQYVNDRPYVASSLLCVAMREVFGTAMAGNCKNRPEAVATVRDLQVGLTSLPCDEGEDLIRRIFEPLGYRLTCTNGPLDPQFPEWGPSPYFNVQLQASLPLQRLLAHLYVLIPVLDDDKHYWIGNDEVDKLLRHGEGWLDTHPEKELIMRRYLGHHRHLYSMSINQLSETRDPGAQYDEAEAAEAKVEQPIRLNDLRLEAVHKALKRSGARSVIDLGCGEGKLMARLAPDPQFQRIAGIDVAIKPLQLASRRLNEAGFSAAEIQKLLIFPSSFLYRDERLNGYDAAVLMEVIEHQESHRLRTMTLSVFKYMRPSTCVITTPNAEYNVRFPTLPAGQFRHPDHRFEWNRNQFQDWANSIAQEFEYVVRFVPIGDSAPELGPPTQMAVFTLQTNSSTPASHGDQNS